MKQIIKPIDGVLQLTAYDRQGRELWSMRQHNQIVKGAYEIAAEALAGLPTSVISKVAAGTNGTEPTENDSAITDPTVVDIQTIEYPAQDTVRFNFTFGYMDGVGKSICEFGLLAADGRLFARKVRQQPIEKTEYMTIKGAWEISGAGIAKVQTSKYPVSIVFDNYKTSDPGDDGSYPLISLYGVDETDNVSDYKIYLFRRIKSRYKTQEQDSEGNIIRVTDKRRWRHPKHSVNTGWAQFECAEFKGYQLKYCISEFSIDKFRESQLYTDTIPGAVAFFGHIAGWMLATYEYKGARQIRATVGSGYHLAQNELYTNSFLLKNLGFAVFKNGVQVSDIKEFEVKCQCVYRDELLLITSMSLFKEK